MRYVLGLILTLSLASSAHAAGMAEGDGYAMRVPLGYTHVEVTDVMADGLMARVHALVPVEGTPTVEVFFKGEQLAPEGVIVVTRGTLRHDDQGKELATLETALQALEGERAGLKSFDIKHRAVNGFAAIELLLRGRIVPGDEREQDFHLLVIKGGSWVMSIVMVHRATAASPALDDWSEMIGSLSLSAPQEAVRRLVVWAGISVAALFVFFLLLRLLRGGAFGRRVDFSREGESLLTGPSAFEGISTLPGAVRAHDGLPVFHSSGGPSRGDGGPPGPASAPPAKSLPGLRSTLRDR